MLRRAASSEEELPEYEVIRRRNIEEIRNAMMKNGTFKEIKCLKHQIKNNTSIKPNDDKFVKNSKGINSVQMKGYKCTTGTRRVQMNTKEKKSSKSDTDNKRVLRKKREDDDDYLPPKKIRSAKMWQDINYAEGSDDDVSSEDEKQTKFKRRRGLPRRAAVRAARNMSYAEIYIPSADEFIFCDYPECQDEYFEGCSIDDHEVVFVDEELATKALIVKESSIKGAGRGVFNAFEWEIPMGVIFGPYTGPILDVEEYEKKEESGYAWELNDPEKKKVIAYVDPGNEGVPDPQKHIFAIINSANSKEDQNLVAVQYRSQVVYRVCKPIPYGKELLTYYGDNYSKHLGIKPELYHQGKKKFPCDRCDKSFDVPAKRWYHVKSIHENATFPCHLCSYKANGPFGKANLKVHLRTVHEKRKIHVCSKCDMKFGFKENLKVHFNTIHLGLKPHCCSYCLKSFTQKHSLQYHLKNIHGVE